MRIRSIARLTPIRRGSRTVPPSISGTPQRRQNTPSTASSSATRRSHHSASSSPPATAWPAIAAITGLLSRSRVGPIGPSPSAATRLPVAVPTAFRSAPAQNTPPSPCKHRDRGLRIGVERPESVGQRGRRRAVDRVAALRARQQHRVTGPSRSTRTAGRSSSLPPPAARTSAAPPAISSLAGRGAPPAATAARRAPRRSPRPAPPRSARRSARAARPRSIPARRACGGQRRVALAVGQPLGVDAADRPARRSAPRRAAGAAAPARRTSASTVSRRSTGEVPRGIAPPPPASPAPRGRTPSGTARRTAPPWRRSGGTACPAATPARSAIAITDAAP